MKILIVDDEPFVLKLLAHQLANLGFDDVTSCTRAHDALALLETGSDAIGFVFCDLNMPEMDGVEFVRHLVRVGYAGGLALVSGEDKRILQTAEKLAKAHKLQMLGALRKPVSPEQLRELLERKFFRAAAARGAERKVHGSDALRQAIANGELENHYQPKVEFASGALTGVETLVRWRHPADGLVFPDQFITTAEDHGLIDELTRAVLAAALRQARLWRDAGLRLRVAVNVSMDNLASLEFPDFVARAAREAEVPVAGLISAPATRRSRNCATFLSMNSRWIEVSCTAPAAMRPSGRSSRRASTWRGSSA